MTDTPDRPRSPLLPTDPFDLVLERVTGLPNGAQTGPAVTQATDYYGNTTSYMVQTVRTEEGPIVFVTQVNAAGAARYIIPPAVIRVMDRQRESTTLQVRRRHGRRLAEMGVLQPGGFTPEMRQKAAATRKRKAAKRRARRGRNAGTGVQVQPLAPMSEDVMRAAAAEPLVIVHDQPKAPRKRKASSVGAKAAVTRQRVTLVDDLDPQ